jgi:hypothetical protein
LQPNRLEPRPQKLKEGGWAFYSHPPSLYLGCAGSRAGEVQDIRVAAGPRENYDYCFISAKNWLPAPMVTVTV